MVSNKSMAFSTRLSIAQPLIKVLNVTTSGLKKDYRSFDSKRSIAVLAYLHLTHESRRMLSRTSFPMVFLEAKSVRGCSCFPTTFDSSSAIRSVLPLPSCSDVVRSKGVVHTDVSSR